MIITHPLRAPWIAWNILSNKKLAIKCWINLLKLPMMSRWYQLHHFPWCGWKQFWQARPWYRSLK